MDGISGMFTIHKLNFMQKYDILRLEDKITSTFLEINLNQVYSTKVSVDCNKILMRLDYDVDIDIYIEN